jgi:hypothetical protein
MSNHQHQFEALEKMITRFGSSTESPAPISGSAPIIHVASIESKAVYLVSRWHVLRRMLGLNFPLKHATVVNLLGTPSPEQMKPLVSLARLYHCPMYFIGDLDPTDLATYYFVKQGGYSPTSDPVAIEYVGISDRWLALCQRHFNRVGSDGGPSSLEKVSSSASSLELELLMWVEEAFDGEVSSMVGSNSYDILKRGFRLELEGASNPAFYSESFTEALSKLLFDDDLR